MLGASATSSFPTIYPAGPFPPGLIINSNIYSYVFATPIGTTEPLSSIANGALTNMVGRIEIAATNELNLSLATLSGMNYLQLGSTNNFDDDGQSLISAPYSDIYLGKTTNSLIFTNSHCPRFLDRSGEVQAWSTGWSYSDTNTGFNYSYRVV